MSDSLGHMDVYDWLTTHEGLTQAEMREQLGMSVKALSNRLTYLQTNKDLVRVVDGRWWINPNPDPDAARRTYERNVKRRKPKRRKYTVREPRQEVEVREVDNGHVSDDEMMTANGIVTTIASLRWPQFIPTEKLPLILEWRDLTEKVLT